MFSMPRTQKQGNNILDWERQSRRKWTGQAGVASIELGVCMALLVLIPIVAIVWHSFSVVVVAALQNELKVVSLREQLRIEMSNGLIDGQMVAVGQRCIYPTVPSPMMDLELVNVVNVAEHPESDRRWRFDIADASDNRDDLGWHHQVSMNREAIPLGQECVDCGAEQGVVMLIRRIVLWNADVWEHLQERECNSRWRVAIVLNPYIDPDGLAWNWMLCCCDDEVVDVQSRRMVRHRNVGTLDNLVRGEHSITGSLLGKHDGALRDHDLVLSMGDVSLHADRDQLEKSYNAGRNSQRESPPIGRRLSVFLVLFFGGFFVSLRGWLNLDDKGRLFGAAWIGGGTLLSAAGLLLWLATFAFPSTWGWWL